MKVQQIIHLQQIGCATDSCVKVQQIMHMQCRGCDLYGVYTGKRLVNLHLRSTGADQIMLVCANG